MNDELMKSADDLLARLRSHLMQMADHQRMREQGKLLIQAKNIIAQFVERANDPEMILRPAKPEYRVGDGKAGDEASGRGQFSLKHPLKRTL